MDDYEQMKIFNPYVQMALGILSGNSGMSKGEAFANAMQGGLRANLGGQEAMDRARRTALEKQQMQMKQSEYDRMQRSVQQTRKFASSMAAKGGPMADIWKGISESDDPDTMIKMGELGNRFDYNQSLKSLREAQSTKPNSYSLPTESDVKNANALLENDPEYGPKYGELTGDQKKAIATKYATAAKKLADNEDPDPWTNAKAIIGTLPETKSFWNKNIKPAFKDLLGW